MKKILIIISVVAVLFSMSSPSFAEQLKHRKVAVQTYSFKNFTLEETLEKLKHLGLDGIEVYGQKLWVGKNVKFGPDMTTAERVAVKKMFSDANLKLVSFGVTGAKDAARIEAICQFAQEMGIERILTESPVELLAVWQKFCEKYGVTMCLHHHTFSSKNMWWNPDFMKKYASIHSRIKSNPDVGHWSRCYINPIEGLRKLAGTIGSVHFKDQREFGNPKNLPVPFGEGQLDCKKMLAELDRQGYDGFFVIEYETKWDDNLSDIAKCVKFLREN